MVVEVVGDVSTIITSVTALIAGVGGIVGAVLAFLRTQKHSDKISGLIQQASNVEGQVMGINKTIDDNKEKIGTIVDVSEKLVPALGVKHDENEAKIRALVAQIDAIKAQLDRVQAITTTPDPLGVTADLKTTNG